MPRPVEEPFEILKQLGRGGFACTYLARVADPELRAEYGEEVVALKVPLGRAEERVLHREMELNAGLHLRLRHLRSPNIVRYLGFEVFQGRVVMVMEYLAEGSLRGRLGPFGRQRRFPPPEAEKLAAGMLRGLALIHAEQVFHRDIKPENILLREGVPKIADLGIARMLDTGELAVTQAGTLPYMSPEILSSGGASYPSDIWSVGVTLYEMVTGRLPFGDERTPIRGMVELICRGAFTPASEVCKEVSPGLSAIIARSLQRDPGARAGALETAEALEALDGGGTPALAPEAELRAAREEAGDPARADAAETRLRQLVGAHPRDPRPCQLLGELLGRRQRYPEAVAMLRQASELRPRDATLLWQLGLALQNTGDRKAAAACVSRALEAGLPEPLRGAASRLLRALGAGPS
jgi:serine/threonine protein kinase